MRTGSLATLAALLSTPALSARAAPPAGALSAASSAEVKRLARLSIREYEAGDFVPALADAVKAFELSGAPGLLFNVAQCHRALEHWKQAEFAYRNYLHENPDAPNRSLVLQLIAQMQAKQAQSPAPAVAPAPPVASAPTTVPVVEAPPPEVKPAWTSSPAPEASVEAAPPARARSHALAWTLLGASAAAGGVAIYGAVRVGNFESLLGQISAKGNYSAYQGALGQAQRTQANASNWQVAAITLGALAAVGVVSGVLTW
ncbi:MAG: hypothetical protein ACYDCL_12140 [Myxococcales bacterium]